VPAGASEPAGAPTLGPNSLLHERQPADKIKNVFERQATLIIDGAEKAAKQLADGLNEQPADYRELDPQTAHEMLHFSPYGIDAPHAFWSLHDKLLEEAIAAGDEDPHAAAERGALDEVYPKRAELALLDVLGPEEKVQRADELMRMSQRQTQKGHTPDRMPFLVSPSGLSREDAVMPGQKVQPRKSEPNGGAAY
jgi:hypothetical protein